MRALRTSAAVVTAALVALAVGAAFGRWQVLPVDDAPPGTRFGSGTAAFVVPSPALSLDADDVVYVSVDGRSGQFSRVVAVVDSWERRVELERPDGRREQAVLPPTVWRVSRVVPYVGVVFDLLVGTAQSIVLVAVGVALIASAEIRRARAVDDVDLANPFQQPRVTDDTRIRAFRPSSTGR